MFIETIKISSLFLIVFIAMRLLGKTLLSQWTAHDLVTVVFLAYAALGAVKINGFLHAVLCIILIMLLYFLLSKLSFHRIFKQIIIGQPTVLIKQGELLVENLNETRCSLTELLSTIRTAGYLNIDDIDYAILEPNGQISVLPKANLRTVRPIDISLNVKSCHLPIPVIEEGRIYKTNLSSIEKSEQWLSQELITKGFRIHEIFYAYYKDGDELVIFPYPKS
ncbi:DUF421 domain-containing protein [Halalkalibacter urbisdiaboli]|uniref:DUF421 domain-containing protein n=1 Tax=Halalkalibacter urbisdiaboli TaxID=1960589 RepID=UPI000B4418AA|nr:YetF domain-containing protein [Halalkalibacter urbisdiaboli]